METYARERTALLFVDPYNDFLSEGGKMWPQLQRVAEEVGLHENLRRLLAAVRARGIQVVVVPHRRFAPGDLARWARPTPYQRGAADILIFGQGTWGGEWHPDFAPQPGDLVAKEHWGSSGFSNTDLDVLLRQRDVTHLILVGLIANTCIECTGRFASELGYHVTLVRDATAAFSPEAMRAAHDVNGPAFAHVVTTTGELLDALAGDRDRLPTPPRRQRP